MLHNPKLLTLALATLLLAACQSAESEPQPPSYSQGPSWQGDVCVTRTKDGRLVRVAPSRCPPRQEAASAEE
jgi:uncharacterized lipoprotein YajG